MKIKLINVGRSKQSYETEVKDEDGILREVSRHLMSSEVEVASDDGIHWDVIVGGFRKVGEVEVIKA